MKRKNWIALAVAVGLTLVGGTALSQAGLAITAGGPPVTASVPAAPTLTLTIATPSEVQIDATSTGADAQLVLTGPGVTVEDSDGGDGVNARIITFLAPGTYEVQVWEWRGGAMTANVAAMVLPPLTAAATITPGAPPAPVTAPAGDSNRASSAEVTVTIATAGNYTIDAVGPATGCDSQLVIVRDNAEVGRDSDSGDENNARWTGPLTPGTYGVRVYDWINRACAINVSVTPAP
jgi:hypothetical protein